MRFDPFEQIPGYAEAVEKEKLYRDAAWLDVPEYIELSTGKVPVLPMRLRHMLELTICRSIFLTTLVETHSTEDLLDAGLITPEGVENFIWAISERREQVRGRWNEKRAKLKFCKRLDSANGIGACEAIKEYIIESFADAPGSSASSAVSYFSSQAMLVHLLAGAYGWPAEYVSELPLKRIWQLLRCQRMESNPNDAMFFNESDKLKSAWLRERRKEREAHNGN